MINEIEMNKRNRRRRIELRLESLGVPVKILRAYEEPHRYFHTWEHIDGIVAELEARDMLSNVLLLVAIFHDIVYNPRRSDNEKASVDVFESTVTSLNEEEAFLVKDIIMSTQHPFVATATIQHKIFNEIDKKIVLNGSFADLIAYERKIFKEFQRYDFRAYKNARVKFLKQYEKLNPHITSLITYIENHTPSIGVYAGSFNPFHLGHKNILDKAEKIFDKVIIARGINPDKNDEIVPLEMEFKQVAKYSGLLTDFINGLDYPVTIIRGLRNSTDLQFEINQYRFLQDLKSDIRVINIVCDKEFEHVSSSAIRSLNRFGVGKRYLP